MPRPSDDVLESWQGFLKAGATYREVARRFGCSMIDVREYCRQGHGRFEQELREESAAIEARKERWLTVRLPPKVIPDLGYLYILSNPSHPRLLKVGKTSKDPRARAEEMFTTGVPTPFNLEWVSLPLRCVGSAERLAHEALAKWRLSDSREFFEIDVVTAVRSIAYIEVSHRINPYGY